jgi:hypothetical protein
MIQYLVKKHKCNFNEVGMDIQPTNQQPISDDQELAKVLAGVNQQADEAATQVDADDTANPVSDQPTATETPDVSAEPSVVPPIAQPEPAPMTHMPTPTPLAPSGDGELDSIKKDALQELRPLVDKLNVSPEEKFDTYLLLLRSTDDKALIAPAHDAAKGITDEARRAQALLDIIKEIDYLAGPQQPPVS